MRIAQIAPLSEAVPPKFYGGTERVVSWITEELVRQGHDVTLFASGDSETSAKLAACTPEGLRLLGRRFAFVLSQVMASSPARAEEAAAVLIKAGQLAPVIVAARADYQDAMLEGLGVTEYAPAGKAAGEMRDLWTWTKGELA